MNYSPPPLFKQGPSATARLVALVMLALALLVIDARLSVLGVVRQVVSVVLYPIERVVLIPRDTARALLEYTQSSTALATDNRNLRESAVAQAQQSLRASQLEAENRNLRTLLNLKQHAVVPTVAAEVLYEARDPYTQRIVIDRGTKDGVRAQLAELKAMGVKRLVALRGDLPSGYGIGGTAQCSRRCNTAVESASWDRSQCYSSVRNLVSAGARRRCRLGAAKGARC